MVNARGWVVVLVFVGVSLLAGFNAGAFRQDLMWRKDWTALQVNAESKGDRLANR